MTPIPFDVLGPFQTTRVAAAKPVEHSSVPRSPFGPRLVAEIDYVAYWARALEVPVSKFIMIYKGPAADMSKVTEEQGKAQTAATSLIAVPSSRTSTGTVHHGLSLRKSEESCSFLLRSTWTVGISNPFSDMKIRTRRGLGAVLQS